MNEVEFLEQYKPEEYERPSVTTDMLIFTIDHENDLSILLIKRGGYPYKGKWAVPGGFVNIDESVECAAQRELLEETGLTNIYMEQLYTMGDVNRDPRMRIISVAYIALVPKSSMKYKAGDDAQDAEIFKIKKTLHGYVLINVLRGLKFKVDEMAFDHSKEVLMGIERLQGKLSYTDMVFSLVKDKSAFTIYEIQKIYEAIYGYKEDTANFRRDFIKKYVKTGKVIALQEKTTDHSNRATTLYKLQGDK